MDNIIHKDVPLTSHYFNYRLSHLALQFYSVDMTPALQIITKYEPPSIISDNLSAYGFEPSENAVFIKDYGVYKGMAECLIKSGIVRFIRTVQNDDNDEWQEVELINIDVSSYLPE